MAALVNVLLRSCEGIPEVELRACPRLRNVDIQDCPKLRRVELGGCAALEQLVIYWGTDNPWGSEVHRVGLQGATALEQLWMWGGGIQALEVAGLEELVALTLLDVMGGKMHVPHFDQAVNNLQPSHLDLQRLTKLRQLSIQCHGVLGVVGLEGLVALTAVKLADIAELQVMSDLGGGLTAVQQLDISRCAELRVVGDSNLGALTSLRVAQCRQLAAVDLRGLTALQQLDISECEQLRVVGGVKDLVALSNLAMVKCPQLPAVDLAGPAVRELRISWSTPMRLEGLQALNELWFDGNDELLELPSLDSLSALEALRVTGCGIQRLDLQGVTTLRRLSIDRCTKLDDLDCSMLGALQTLDMHDCGGLQSVVLGAATALKRLELSNCSGLGVVVGLEELAALTALRVASRGWDDGTSCTWLPTSDLRALTALQELRTSSGVLQGLEGLQALTSLEFVAVRDWQEGLLRLTALSAVRDLCVYGCNDMRTLQLWCPPALKELDIRHCRALQRLELHQSPASLTHLYVSDTNELKEVVGLEQLVGLKEWRFHRREQSGLGGREEVEYGGDSQQSLVAHMARVAAG
jgi:Leucine-rich repeat (LRR) protein